MASGRPTPVRACRRWLLPAALIAVAATLGGCTPGGPALAQPNLPEDLCADAINNVFGGIPGLGLPGGPGGNGSGSNISINSGNNVSIQTGPNNISINSTSTGDSTNGENNVVTCCVNGRCCVSSGIGPANCTP